LAFFWVKPKETIYLLSVSKVSSISYVKNCHMENDQAKAQISELTGDIASIYMRYGIKSVTMDDLARELGVSKKTIYQHFRDKEDVVQQVIHSMIHYQECGIETVLNNPGLNAIDHLLQVSRFISSHMKSINPSLTFDLKKFYPAIWKEVLEFKRKTVYEHIMGNIQRGISEGLFLEELNYRVIASVYVSRLEVYTLEQPELQEFSFDDVFTTLFVYHIRGIASPKGIRYLEKLMQQEQVAAGTAKPATGIPGAKER
jgi:TetR/AcrR family transcriptional regulator, cholesterol catabolism regulator